MDETAVIEQLRALGREPVAPDVADRHRVAIAAVVPDYGVRPRNLVAAAVAFAILAGGAVSLIWNAADDPSPQPSPVVTSSPDQVVVDPPAPGSTAGSTTGP